MNPSRRSMPAVFAAMPDVCAGAAEDGGGFRADAQANALSAESETITAVFIGCRECGDGRLSHYDTSTASTKREPG